MGTAETYLCIFLIEPKEINKKIGIKFSTKKCFIFSFWPGDGGQRASHNALVETV